MCFFVACGMHSMNICEFSESDSEVCHENWPLDGHYLEVAGVLHILSAIRAAHLGVLYMCFVQMCVWVSRFACFVKIFYCIYITKEDCSTRTVALKPCSSTVAARRFAMHVLPQAATAAGVVNNSNRSGA